MSWAIPSFFKSPASPSSSSSLPPPNLPATGSLHTASRGRPRFPAPPTRPSHSSDQQSPSTPPTGIKRERGWLPRSSSYGGGGSPERGTPGGSPELAQAAVSPTRAEGAFDTPRAYLHLAATSHDVAGLRSDNATATSAVAREVDQECDELEDERPVKKRKGLAGMVLSSALDAALFTTALGFSAYQLWKNPPNAGDEYRSSEDDIDAVLAARSLRQSQNAHPGKHSTQDGFSPRLPPPPYTEIESNQSVGLPPTPPRPSQIPRRAVRHAHTPRPRPSGGRRSFPSPESIRNESLETTSSASIPNLSDVFAPQLPESLSRSYYQNVDLPSFVPYTPVELEGGESTPDDEGDAEMDAVAARLEALINNGREALSSGLPSVAAFPNPEPWGSPEQGTSGSRRNSIVPVPQSPRGVRLPPTPRSPKPKPHAGAGRKSHAPRSSRGGSLGGEIGLGIETDGVRRGGGSARNSLGKSGGAEILEGVIQRARENSGRGWWEAPK